LYPDGLEYDYRYISARGGKFKKSVVYGIQIYLKRYLEGVVLTKEAIEYAKIFAEKHGEPFNYEGWMYILENHNGKLPIEIRSIPEGTVVDIGNVICTIVNTDKKCGWLPGYLEPTLLRAVWYGTTVATYSREIISVIKDYLEETGSEGSIESLPFRLHDFGARGVSSAESCEIGSSAHLVNSMGSDSIEGILAANIYYGFKDENSVAAFSIPATEHSITTSEGKEGEIKVFEKVIDTYSDYHHYACVIDGYDPYNAVSNVLGKKLKEKIINGKGIFVVRPDSGVPKDMVLEIVRRLYESFGGIVNDKGYIVLHPKVSVIQGDGVNLESIKEILENLKSNGFSTENVTFGCGGKLLQDGISRDLMQFAMKSSAMKINGEWRGIGKDPITDQSKKSKKGLVTTYKVDGKYIDGIIGDYETDELVTVFKDGELFNVSSFDEVRERAKL
jgi:nicotinamide phosphoribosyltransferase